MTAAVTETQGGASMTQEVQLERGTSLWNDAYKRLKKNKMALAGLMVSIAMIVAAMIGPIIVEGLTGYTLAGQARKLADLPPSWGHWFGTDGFGRDILLRCLYALRVSLAVGLLGAGLSALLGTVIGAVAGYFGGWIDTIISRIIDVLYTLPYMLFVIVLMAFFENRSIVLLFVALACIGWLTTGRIVRGQVLSLKEHEFVQAAKALGAGHVRIIFQHLIPNSLGAIIIYFTLTVPNFILQEAFLSFLGLGVQAPMPSLGSLINEGANRMEFYPWQLVFPTCVMALLLFSLNFVGDGLRDALDPKMKR